MGKSLEHKLSCGCEFWQGSDHNGEPYILVEHCSVHKNVKVEELENSPTSDKAKLLKPGEPCKHVGCLKHILHPCEGCGRIAGRGYAWLYQPGSNKSLG